MRRHSNENARGGHRIRTVGPSPRVNFRSSDYEWRRRTHCSWKPVSPPTAGRVNRGLTCIVMLTFTRVLGKCLTITTAAEIIVMMVHIVVHALTRSLFDAPIYGTNEIVEYWYLPVVALLGIPAAQLQKEHITVP